MRQAQSSHGSELPLKTSLASCSGGLRLGRLKAETPILSSEGTTNLVLRLLSGVLELLKSLDQVGEHLINSTADQNGSFVSLVLA